MSVDADMMARMAVVLKDAIAAQAAMGQGGAPGVDSSKPGRKTGISKVQFDTEGARQEIPPGGH